MKRRWTWNLAAIGFMLLVFIGVSYYVARSVFLKSIYDYERRDMAQSLGLVDSSLLRESELLSATSTDWSFWDDTYNYAKYHNRSYIDNNVTDEMLANVNLRYFVLFNNDKDEIFSVGYRTPLGRINKVPTRIIELLRSHVTVIGRGGRRTKPDIIFIDGEPLIVSHTDVLPSSAIGRKLGTLFMLRAVDFSRMTGNSAMDVSLSLKIPGHNLIWTSENGNKVAIDSKSESRIKGFLPVKTLDGKQIYIRVEKRRDIYHKSVKSAKYFAIPLLVMWAALFFSILGAIDRVIYKQLMRLGKAVSSWDVRPEGKEGMSKSSLSELAINGLMAIYNDSPIGIALFDTRGLVTHRNRRFREMLSLDDNADVNIYQTLLSSSAEESLRRGLSLNFETKYCDKHIECVVSGISMEKTSCNLLQVQDVTERYLHQSQLRYQAYHDALTDLPNRRYFVEAIDKLVSDNVRASVLLIDLDNFKNVNDTLGHDAGDQLLCMVGNALRECIGSLGSVMRLGGDEFAVLTTSFVNEKDIDGLALAIEAAVNRPVVLRNLNLRTTASVGIVYVPEHGQDSSTVVRRADLALYQAKKNRNCHFTYESRLEKESNERLCFRSELELALENRQLEAYYQPLVSLKTGEVEALEALVRWNSPKSGLISPGEFIPLAEELGIISLIDKWVITEACKQASDWHALGLGELSVCVNLSLQSLLDGHLTAWIKDALYSAQLEPRFLKVEITESIAMKDPEATISAIRSLLDIGVSMSLDDFGMGYSSFNYLKQLPLSNIKIPRDFVTNVPQSKENVSIVKAILLMAKDYEIPVIAEGVELESEYDFLNSLDCDYIQGYYHCPPKPASEITSFLMTKIGPPVTSKVLVASGS